MGIIFGTLGYNHVHDYTALFKTFYLIGLCAVMLIVYISALNICIDADWSDNPELDKYVDSDCRFYFYDRTYKFNGQKIQQGNVFVIYYIILWGSLFVASCISSCVLCLKCGTCVRRFFSIFLFGGLVVLVGSDVISTMITWGHYDDAIDTLENGTGNDILAARFTYVGLNIVILVMQMYIFLNTIYDIADHGDQAEKEERAALKAAEDTVSLIGPRV